MDILKLGLDKGYIKFDEEQKFITYTFQNKKNILQQNKIY